MQELSTFPDGSTQPLQNQKFYKAGYTNSVIKQKIINVWIKLSQKELQGWKQGFHDGK